MVANAVASYHPLLYHSVNQSHNKFVGGNYSEDCEVLVLSIDYLVQTGRPSLKKFSDKSFVDIMICVNFSVKVDALLAVKETGVPTPEKHAMIIQLQTSWEIISKRGAASNSLVKM